MKINISELANLSELTDPGETIPNNPLDIEKSYLETASAGLSTSKPFEPIQGCGSGNCPRAKECGRFLYNLDQPAYIENYASFGWASIGIGKDGNVEQKGEYFCGPLGDYKMFIPKE